MKAPNFVRLKHGTCLRLRDGRYYRDAGDWDVAFEEKKGKLYVKADYPQVRHLNGWELIRVSEKEWHEDNGAYVAPKGSKR